MAQVWQTTIMVMLFTMIFVIIFTVDFGETDNVGRKITGENKKPSAMETCMPGIASGIFLTCLYTMRNMILRWRSYASELVVYED
jgi:hypothetical protein